MTADELHALAVRTRDAARLAERHGTSTHGYRRAAREACERMGEMAEQLAEALRSRETIAQDRLSRHLADQRKIDGLARAAEETSIARAAAAESETAEWRRLGMAQAGDLASMRGERDAALAGIAEVQRLRAGAEVALSRAIARQGALEADARGARTALRDLVAALSLDDGPRAKAIQHARAVLEEWEMR